MDLGFILLYFYARGFLFKKKFCFYQSVLLILHNVRRIGEEAELNERLLNNFLLLIRNSNVHVQHVSRFFANTNVARCLFVKVC